MKHIAVIKNWRETHWSIFEAADNFGLHHCWITSDNQIEFEVSVTKFFALRVGLCISKEHVWHIFIVLLTA